MRFFGTYSLGELIGITSAIAVLAGAFAPYFSGFVFDITGSYFMAFIVIMVFLICGSLVALLLKEPTTM